MNEPLISVIVPVYGIERYIGLCLESILCQTYGNLEIIAVDDGSPDRSPQILDLYASKDPRIHVIHKPNEGLVSARKAGLRASNGEYVAYVDGDDWIGPGFIESLYTAASIAGTDMVCSGHTRDLFTKSSRFTNTVPAGIYEDGKLCSLWKEMICSGAFYHPGVTTYVWNKLFRREILQQVQFSVDNRITLGEDAAVTYPALMLCKKVAVIDSVAYHYRQREDSMLKQSGLFSDDARRLSYLYDYLERWAAGKDTAEILQKQVTDYVLSLCIIRSGGRLPQDTYSTFDPAYFGKRVVICSAGTFGQQLAKRFSETGHCTVAGWIDDDYWEYRRCGLNVDPAENITRIPYDYVLTAAVDRVSSGLLEKKLLDLGVHNDRILKVTVPEERENLLARFLDTDAIRKAEEKNRRKEISHA